MKYIIILAALLFSIKSYAETIEIKVNVRFVSLESFEPNVENCIESGDGFECDDMPEPEPVEAETILVWEANE